MITHLSAHVLQSVFMQLKDFNIVIALLLIVLLSCSRNNNKKETAHKIKSPKQTIQHAKHFNIEVKNGYRILSVLGKKNTPDTTAVFVLYDSVVPNLEYTALTFKVKVPCTRMAALSSIYSAMLAEVGALEQVVAIDNIDYINKKDVLEKHRLGQLAELSKGPALDLEKTILIKPDMVFMFGMGNPLEEAQPKLITSRIPFALIVDHLEETPLARAEWIKFVAAFAGKAKQADSIFNAVQAHYLRVKDSAQKFTTKPNVLTELKYSDTWYVPGGKSFMAALIQDAGAKYAWRENQSRGSIPLSFEQVYRMAVDADVWINLSMVKNKREMLEQDERYQKFRAFQNNRLYNNNKRTNAKGYSDYWETAMFHPERVLSDLTLIFHTEEVKEKELYYYIKIR
jgi:iron complex transport system substrate-binding protein